MTFRPPEGPLPEVSTTRVAGGSSARLVAVAVAGLLIAVAGFTVVNRPPAPAAPSPTAPAVAAVPTPVPTPSPPRNQLEGDDGILGWPVVAQLRAYGPPVGSINQRPDFRYTALIQITGGLIRAAMAQEVPEDYRSEVVIDTADVGNVLPIEIGRQWTESGLLIYESFAAWQINLKQLLKSRGGQVALLIEHVPPGLTPGLPGALASGYTFTVIGRKSGTRLNLSLELVWPASAQLAAYGGPRGPGLFNRCRWGDGPQGAPPRSTSDEAGCLGG
ncbi:MAG: hypothetical protein ABI725_00685 [Chloroflexota bacterium]